MRATRVRGVCVGVVVVGSLLSVPAITSAAFKVGVSDNDPRLLVVRGDDSPDRIRTTYDRGADAFAIGGEGGVLLASAAAPCVESSESLATCPAEGITGLRFRLGGGNDRVTVTLEFPGNSIVVDADGGSGNDLLRVTDSGISRLVGGRGNDRILARGRGRDRLAGGDGDDTLTALGRARDSVFAGTGDDVVRARGGGRDRIRCGDGADTVIADSRDIVSSDCETVGRRG